MGDELSEGVSGIAATPLAIRRETAPRKWLIRMKGAMTSRRRKRVRRESRKC